MLTVRRPNTECFRLRIRPSVLTTLNVLPEMVLKSVLLLQIHFRFFRLLKYHFNGFWESTIKIYMDSKKKRYVRSVSQEVEFPKGKLIDNVHIRHGSGSWEVKTPCLPFFSLISMIINARILFKPFSSL